MFVLASAWMGASAVSLASPRILAVIAALMSAACLPWLLRINSRPLIPIPGTATVNSILRESREALYLANHPGLLRPYAAMTARIAKEKCSQVGIMLAGNAAEYPLWVMLGAPRRDLTIEWIVAGTPSARYSSDIFSPCAVICESCPEEKTEIRGLPLMLVDSGYQLYLRETQE
jgi:hypothetical protein